MQKLITTILLTVTLIFLLQGSSIAQKHNQDISQRTSNAELVFEGKITKKTSFWNSTRTRIFTANEITVSKVFKGEVPQTIEIVTHGGEVDGLMHHIGHTVTMPMNGEGIFFCKYFDNSSNRADRFLMLNGQSGVIYYDIRNNGFQARDKFGTYKNLQRDVFDVITQHINNTPTVYKKNVFEQKASDWLNENLSLFSMNDTIIEFSFDNIQLIGITEVEFDIFVKSNTAGIKFAATDIYLQYSTEAFGASVVQNDRMSASKETVIEDAVYTLDLVDHEADVARLLINSNFQPVDFYPLSQTLEKFLHVTLDIENIFELANVSFDGWLMANQSMFYDENTGEYVGFNKIIVSPPFNPFLVPDIMNFFGEDALNPHHITAGTQEVLTIQGSGFLDVKGTIEFYDVDNNLGLGKVETSESDIISWNDLEIKVRVPSSDADGTGHTAGTGFFKVVLPNNDEATSDDVLRVDYSVYNFRTGGGTSVPINLGDAEEGDGNDNGELIFSLSNDMEIVAGARDIIEQSLCDWNVETQVNWDLAPLPSANITAMDGDMTNLIYFGDEVEFTGDLSGLGAYVVLTLGGNDRRVNCTGAGHVFQREIDIVFREGANLSNADPALIGWHYTDLAAPTNPAINEVDFYSYVLHELGHAHMLRHVRENPKIMNVPSGGGYVNRTFEPEDEEGGEFVLTKSEERYNAGGGCNEMWHTTFVNTMGLCGMIDNTIDLSNQESAIKYYQSEGSLVFSIPEMGYAGRYSFRLYSVDGSQMQSNSFDINDGQTEKIIYLSNTLNHGLFVFELINENSSDRLSGRLILTQ